MQFRLTLDKYNTTISIYKMDIKFSVKQSYAVIAMLALLRHSETTPLKVTTIAKRHRMSTRFLSQVMGALKQAGFVRSVRGKAGGYALAKPPQQPIRLSEILQAIAGAPVVGRPANASTAAQLLSEVETETNAALTQHLHAVTLQGLVDRLAQMEAGRAPMFHI